MKKIFVTLIIVLCFFVSGCSFNSTMDNIEIYTTIYPIEYIVKNLYQDHATIYSTYPKDTKDVTGFKLTDKQYTDISKTQLFVYDGLSKNEINFATTILKKNKNIKIIDATMGMEAQYDLEELWLDPSNMMMLLQNTKNGMNEYITSTYLTKEVDENYENTKLLLSELDVEVKDIAKVSKNKLLIVGNKVFKFLEKYGYNILCLDDDATSKDITDAKAAITNGTTKYVYIANNKEKPKNISKLEELGASVLELDMLNTISAKDDQDKKDYVSIVKNNIELLKRELYR